MMRRVELQDLLPAGTASEKSRREVLQEVVSVSVGSGSLAGGGGGGSVTGGEVGSLLQGPAKNVTDQLSSLASQITTLNSTQQTQLGVLQDNTQAITQNTNTKGSG